MAWKSFPNHLMYYFFLYIYTVSASLYLTFTLVLPAQLTLLGKRVLRFPLLVLLFLAPVNHATITLPTRGTLPKNYVCFPLDSLSLPLLLLSEASLFLS